MAPTLLFLILSRPSVCQNQAPADPSIGIFSAAAATRGYGQGHLRAITNMVLMLYEMGYEPNKPGPPVLRNRRRTFSVQDLPRCPPFFWKPGETYDVVIPFGDGRDVSTHSVWMVDFPNDTITLHQHLHRSVLPVSRILNRDVSLTEFTVAGLALPLYTKPTLVDERVGCWKPDFSVDPRLRALGHCLLREFDFQWRHILRANYNRVTLRVLARAVLYFSTLRFEVREKIGSEYGKVNPVSIQKLPKWKPLKTDILRLGDIHVVVCQSLQHGLSTAMDHAQLHTSVGIENHSGTVFPKPHYVLLSVKGIALCRVTNKGMEATAPEPLFNGQPAAVRPSDRALDQLLWAMSHAYPPIETPLLKLPTEIQDMVLGYVSHGSIVAAKIGCQLAVGSPFEWSIDSNAYSAKGCRYLTLNRGPWSATTSQIMLDGYVSYLAFLES